MQKKKKEKENHFLWIVVGIIAVMCGITSFAITVHFYDDEISQKVLVQNDANNRLKEVLEEPIQQLAREHFAVPDKLVEEEKVVLRENNQEEKPMIVEMEYPSFQTDTPLSVSSEEEVIETISQNNQEKENLLILEEPYELPISGKVGLPFAKEELVYSKTLKEWKTHTGVDLLAKELSPVKAIGDGMIESVKTDPRYGNTIVVVHPNGDKSVYANLSTLELVYVGKEVKKGEIISGVGKAAGYEAEEEPHIHLEIIQNGEYTDPLLLLK